ncbi:hypothetical protein [Metabacillus sp. FJAT-52054]|uniref:Uncharacterized protein n=1 Tax=Metabacillus sediminis TaxID=3117746 RepID=A0ABZ2NFH1_9BACI
MLNQIILWSLFICPFFLLFFFHKKNLKRFVGSALFGSILLTILFQMANRFQWCEVKENIPILTDVTSFVYGVFFIGTILILALTYGDCMRYMLLNAAIDAVQAFILNAVFEHLGIYKLVNMTPL